ncbi:MAG TPA: response regulator transcription factor [Casimicrobiaceae bacterium]
MRHVAASTRSRGNTAVVEPKPMRILVVEDDALLATGLTLLLTQAGHGVDHANSGRQAESALRERPYELVVLDIGLPDIDGFEVLSRLRLRQSKTNVLILTARDTVEDRVRGLDLGADDYLTKPFSLTEFEARVRALLRRTSLPMTSIAIGGLVVDVQTRRIKANGASVEFTVREWELMELFLNQPGRVLNKDTIVQRMFGCDEHSTPNTIEVYISRLRAKIEAAGVRIRTVRGVGYMLESLDG